MDCGVIWKNKKKPMLTEVVKDDFVMDNKGKKEYDRRTQKRNETNWKEKSFHGNLRRLCGQRFVAMVKVRICKKEHRSNYYRCSRLSIENKLDKIKYRLS